jgi:hypothetical protein
VERLLELFNRTILLVKGVFNNDHRFLTARDKAYKVDANDTQLFRLELKSKRKVGIKHQPEFKCPE